mgnify:CR=1 FL=1
MSDLKSNAAKKIHMESVDEIFGIPKKDDSTDGIQEIRLSDLYSFRNHPFQVRDDEEMAKLADSIRENGVLVPIIARPRSEGGYEIISGHRRKHASELAGLDTIPAIVKNYGNDEATVIMVDSNLQRENLLPSERAKAYKMKLEAMKRQGKRTDLTSCQLGTKLRADVRLAQNTNDSARTIQRYIRLTELISDLLKLVDEKKFSFNSAVEISYLNHEEQNQLLENMQENGCAPSVKQARRLKQLSQTGELDASAINAIMLENKEEPVKVTLPGQKLKEYFPADYTPAQMEDVILKLLKRWKLSEEQ